MSASRSWGHAIEVASAHRVTVDAASKWPWYSRCHVRRGCDGRTVYLVSYVYVTGRQGRTTRREQTACAECASTFAKKHILQLPAVLAEVAP